MNGKDYRALRPLSIFVDGRFVTVAGEGDTCEHVPKVSLPSLLASGKIEPVVRQEHVRDIAPRMTLAESERG